MRNLFLSLSLLLCFFNGVSVDYSFAATNLTYYAKVDTPSTFMYSLPLKNENYKLFEIPLSYYVILYGDENQNFYKARYSGIEGYVLKDSITPVNEVPNYAFASTSFRIFSPTYLYSSTNKDAETLASLPALTTITTYYGEQKGEELIPSSTTTWYYCSYIDEEGIKSGYVFSYFCDQFQKIQTNTESFTPYQKELVFTIENDSKISAGLSSTAKAIIIIACVIPCLLILCLLLKKRPKNQTHQRKIIRKPKRDYYEFNEDDI